MTRDTRREVTRQKYVEFIAAPKSDLVLHDWANRFFVEGCPLQAGS
ncbi:MAG: hypothetical protein M0Z80_11485 [Treponema sp.]|nr:hypothetical protein [Treponema sp.]